MDKSPTCGNSSVTGSDPRLVFLRFIKSFLIIVAGVKLEVNMLAQEEVRFIVMVIVALQQCIILRCL